MTDAYDVRVADVLTDLPGKERRAVTHAPYRSCLDALLEELDDDETVRAISCATNASFGRGVLALTESRLVFCCTKSGAASWSLDEIDGVDGRIRSFTLPAAITLHLENRDRIFTLGAGRRYGPQFISAVESALGSQKAAA
jgi:hypothetical protein